MHHHNFAMGCMNAKLVPEDPPPDSKNIVKTVLTTGHEKERGKSVHHRKLKNAQMGNPEKGLKAGHPDERTKGTEKGKWTTKFPQKVTAKYEIKALIGKGTFSRVIRVEHRTTKQPYAMKMINNVHGKEVFESELMVLRRVKHRYIIQLIEVMEFPDKVFVVMELATGGELFDRIMTKGCFTERDATRVLQMVLDGLNYLHKLGITHRDLKPENLLYYHPGHDSKILITDFGLSAFRKTGEGNYMRTTCGTPEYIAPEILYKKPYSSQVDLWAVGVITYILLSGTMPFDDENKSRLYRLIIKVRYNYNGEVHIRYRICNSMDVLGRRTLFSAVFTYSQ